MKPGDVVEIAVPSLESQWQHGLKVGQQVRVHQVFDDEPRRMTVEVGGELRMVLPSEVREVRTFAVPHEAIKAAARAICASCGEMPDSIGDARGNAYRLQDYEDSAQQAIAAALPHILGEPVAWRDRTGNLYPCRDSVEKYAPSRTVHALYAPSIRPVEKNNDEHE